MRANAYLNGQDILNWYKTPEEMTFSEHGFPELEPLQSLSIPRQGLRTLPFNYALSSEDKDYFVHFYIQDYLFNRIWNNPQRYIDVLKQYKGIVMPDFSMFTDMPEPLQRFNHYRNLWFARMCQLQGITVIPSLNWSTEDSLKWCYEGLPQNSIFMLSAIGSIKNTDTFKKFKYCYIQLENKLTPKSILCRCTKNNVRNRIFDFISVPFLFCDYIV